MPALGLYVQIPFCASKCSFCNFSSRVERREAIEAYMAALEEEIARLPRQLEEHGIGARLLRTPAETIYFGGGTPPLAGRTRLARVLDGLAARFHLAASAELTMEATPGSADEPFLEWALRASVNRLSIGAQSFADREIAAVGRLHSAEATRELVRAARRAGFKNISLDLIAGLPHQTMASWQESLRDAASLLPQHLSVYLFEIDEKSRLGSEVLLHGTRYHAGQVPGEDFMADAYEEARAFLAREGYGQYEISNFALPGFESRHNRKYWRRDPVLGLGAGAHSFDGEQRWENVASAVDYVKRIRDGASPLVRQHRLKESEELEEFFFLGLRESQGVDLHAARGRWGSERVGEFERIVQGLAERGLVGRTGDRVRLSEQAYLISNEIFQEFLLNV